MIRQLERAANSVAGGAEATAATLSTIRQRTDALTEPHQRRPGHRDDLFARRRQVHPVGAGDRLPGARRRQARRPGQRRRPRSQRQCRPPAGIIGGDRQCRQPDRADRTADHAAGAQFHHRGRTRRRGRARLCGGRHRGEGARGADPERDGRDHQEDRGAAARRRGLGRRRASHLAGDRGDPPGVRERQRRGRRAERDDRRNGRQCGFRLQLHRLGRRQRHRDRSARPRKPKSMAKASPKPDGPSPHLRRSSSRVARCCCGRETKKATAEDRRKDAKAALQPQDRNCRPARGDIGAGLRNFDGRHSDQRDRGAEELAQGQSFNATLQDVGACRIGSASARRPARRPSSSGRTPR